MTTARNRQPGQQVPWLRGDTTCQCRRADTLFLTPPSMAAPIVPVNLTGYRAGRRLVNRQSRAEVWSASRWPIWHRHLPAGRGSGRRWSIWATRLGRTERSGSTNAPVKKIHAVTVQSPWLMLYENDLHRMIPAARLALIVPAMIVSVFVERWILRLVWRRQERAEITRFSWVSRPYSYPLLLVAVTISGCGRRWDDPLGWLWCSSCLVIRALVCWIYLAGCVRSVGLRW